MHRRRQSGLQRSLPEPDANLLRAQALAAGVDEQRPARLFARIIRHRLRTGQPQLSRGQPVLQSLQRLAADRHTAPLAPLAEHMRFGGVEINPATRHHARAHIEPDQLANAQAAAIKQFGDAMVARLARLIGKIRLVVGTGCCAPRVLISRQLHRFVHA